MKVEAYESSFSQFLHVLGCSQLWSVGLTLMEGGGLIPASSLTPAPSHQTFTFVCFQGATIRKDEETGEIFIARVIHGGLADRSGEASP